MHQIIFVPGLGDNSIKLSLMLKLWEKENIKIHIHLAPWKETEESFEKKLERLIEKIDLLTKNNTKVSLLGTSAGGSFIINAYNLRKNKIHKLITISSRLLKGERVFPSLNLAALRHPAFKDSVIRCERILPTLSPEDKAKMMTTQSQFFDEVVPLSTMTIPEVENLKVPVPFHVLSIAATVTLYRKNLIEFIKTP